MNDIRYNWQIELVGSKYVYSYQAGSDLLHIKIKGAGANSQEYIFSIEELRDVINDYDERMARDKCTRAIE